MVDCVFLYTYWGCAICKCLCGRESSPTHKNKSKEPQRRLWREKKFAFNTGNVLL